MFLRSWRMLTLTLTALTMGLLFCHTLEMPAKLQYEGSLYVTVQNSLYRLFGPPLGASIEVGSLITSLVLAFLVRKHRKVFYWTVAGALCLAIALAAYFVFTEPVNVVIEQSSSTSVPANLAELRRQWEYSHAARFGLYLAGFLSLVNSILLETSKSRFKESAS